MHSLITWFAQNRVAANLLMAFIVITGLYAISQVPIESSPQFERNSLYVKFAYPGATPQDIEESVITRIEDAVYDLPGITALTSTAREGGGSVTMKVADDYHYREVLDEIDSRIELITSFPDDLEDLETGRSSLRFEVISVAISGELPELELRTLGKDIRDQLVTLPGINQVELTGIRPFEISIEIAQHQLQKYDLRLPDVVDAIRQASVNLPAGSIKEGSKELLIRTKGQRYHGADFADIVITTRADGSRLLLKEIAQIKDGFVDEAIMSRFNGKPGVLIEVYRSGDQDAITVAQTIKQFIARHSADMPAGVELSYWRDRSKYIDNRITSLLQTALMGSILVFIVLSLFLHIELAFWVVLGIPVSIIGAFAFMPVFDVTINYTSIFAFILVLGIVVDDAIVTGENIFKHLQQHEDPNHAVISGTREVAVAVTFGVLTTVVAFAALLMMEGDRSKMFTMIPPIVIPVLLLSLVETKLILPSHLKHIDPDNHLPGFGAVQRWIDRQLQRFVVSIYQPLLNRALQRPALTLSIFFSVLLIIASTVFSGWIRFTFFPKVQSEVVRAKVILPEGSPYELTHRAVIKMEHAAQALKRKYNQRADEPIITNIYSSVGVQGRVELGIKPNEGYVSFEVVPPEVRAHPVTSVELSREWRKQVGPMPGVRKLSFRGSLFKDRNPIDFMLKGQDFAELKLVADKIRHQLAQYPGVFDIADDFSQGQEQIELSIKPEAEQLGISARALGGQMRGAFHGIQTQRLQRDGEEVNVYVRYPQQERQTLNTLQHMKIKTDSGQEIPLHEVADISLQRAPAIINRSERYRTLHVTANANKKTVQLPVIEREMNAFIKNILPDHPEVSYVLEGEAKETRESMGSLGLGIALVLLAIYALLAIPFQSYSQPFIVMSVIPFGLTGSVLGHLMLGMDLTIQSVLGMLALIGVVVNDSLVLVDVINRSRQQGMALFTAVSQAGAARFRAILLTSLTTFIGLIPMMSSSNTQAQFLVPMAVSLAFGVLFATFITLLLVPCFYLLLENSKIAIKNIQISSKEN